MRKYEMKTPPLEFETRSHSAGNGKKEQPPGYHRPDETADRETKQQGKGLSS